MAGIFKSGCIRGPYPNAWDADTAYRIGRYLPDVLQVYKYVIGRDARKSSDEIFASVARGLTESGADVYDLGLVDTPALYFANFHYRFPGSIMITASHNPPGDNGMKIHTKDVVNVIGPTGLDEIEKRLQEGAAFPEVEKTGLVQTLDLKEDYLQFLTPYKEKIGNLKVVIDCMNGCAAAFIHDILDDLPGTYILLNDRANGNFSEHGPNPLVPENTRAFSKAVLEHKADLGICFDGDADRAVFVDEKGQTIMPDLMLAYLARYYFIHFPEKARGSKGVVYDLRCSNNVRDYVDETLGGESIKAPGTGHTAMRTSILDNQALLGAELSGHYYLRDNAGQDTAWVVVLMALAILSNEHEPLSASIKKINRHAFSGEINFKVPEPQALLPLVEAHYRDKDCCFDRQEGLKAEFGDWWFLLRGSSTEPVLRLVVEAADNAALKSHVEELKNLIRSL